MGVLIEGVSLYYDQLDVVVGASPTLLYHPQHYIISVLGNL